MVYESLTKMLTIGTDGSFAVLNLFDPVRETVDTRAISGDGALIRLASRILNFDIRRGGWTIDGAARRMLALRRFTELGGLRDVAAGQLPAKALGMVERLTGIKTCYGRGLQAAGNSLGYLILFFRDTLPDAALFDRLEKIADCIEEMLPELIAAEEGACREPEATEGTSPLLERESYAGRLFAEKEPEFTPDIYLGLDRGFTIVFANHAVRLLGLDREEVLGRGLEAVATEPGLSEIRKGLERIMGDPAATSASRSLQVPFCGDRRFRVVMRRTPTPEGEGNAEAVTLVMREISKEHTLSVAFLQREEMLRQLADAMSEAVWIEAVDPPQIIYTNPRFEHLFGLDPSLPAQDPSILSSLLESPHGALRENREGSDNDRPTQAEYRLNGRGGQERWLRIKTYPILSPDTQPLFIHIASDVTRRRAAQRELERQHEAARLLLHEMNHRIKNNLSIVAGLTGLAADRIADPEGRSEIQLLENRISSIALVHELLFSAPDSSLMDFGAYCRNLVAILEPTTADGAPIRIESSFAAYAVPPSTSGILGMILTELITNAAKHAFPSHWNDPAIVLSFTAGEPAVNGPLELKVRDNGIVVRENPLTAAGESLGMEILTTLVAQIGGEIRFRQEKGWKEFAVAWPRGESAG